MYQNIINTVNIRQFRILVLVGVLFTTLSMAAETGLENSSHSWLKLLEQGSQQLPLRIERMEELIHITLANNSQLQAKYSEWKMRMAEVGSVVNIPDPTLSAGYFLEPVETAQGPQKAKLSLSQSLPWPSKYKAAKQARIARADRAFEVLNQARLDLIRELGIYWSELSYLRDSQLVLEQKIAHSKDLEAILRTRYTSASISHEQYGDAQIQTLRLGDQLESLNDRLNRLRVNLSTLMELKTPIDLDLIPINILNSSDPVGDMDKVNNHPRIQVLEKMRLEVDALQTQARADYLPDLKIGLDYIITDPKSVDGIELSGSGQDPLVVSLGIAVPLLNWNQKRSVLESRKWQLKQVNNQRKHEESQMFQELQILSSKLTEKNRQISLYENDLVPKAQEVVNVMEQAYISQSVDIAGLTNAKQRLLDLELELLEAKHAARVHMANLNYLRGD